MSSTSTPPSPFIALPTKRRSEVVEMVSALRANMEQFGWQLPIVIFEDGPESLNAPQLPPYGRPHPGVFHVGKREKEAFIELLARELRRSGSTLLREAFRVCYGGNRNFTALYSAGTFMLSFDDDMRPYATCPASGGLPLSGNEVARGSLTDRTSHTLRRIPNDVVGPYLSILGKTVGSLPSSIPVGSFIEDTAMELATNATKGLAPENTLLLHGGLTEPERVVRMAQAFRCGTNDIDAIDFVEMFLRNPSLEQIDPHPQLYVMDAWRAAVTALNGRMDCGVAGYDNRNGIPPFIPSDLRFEDFLFRLWIQQPAFAAAHVSAVFTHLKSSQLRYSHAHEVFNEEVSNLIKRKMVQEFTPKAVSIEFGFDGCIDREDVEAIAHKIRELRGEIEAAAGVPSIALRRRQCLLRLIAGIDENFFELDSNFLYFEIARRVERDFRLIVELNDLWPVLMELCIDLPWHSLPLTRLD